MADNSNNRKKALVISVLAFLFAGGGIFLFFVVQGANDITGAGKKNTFSYGFAVREAVLPLFKRMGITTYEDELAEGAKQRVEGRGIELPSAGAAPAADISDWMAKDTPSAAPVSSGRPAASATVPKMAGRAGSPVGGAGGGGSKSAGSVSRFGGASSTGMTSASGGGAGGGPGASEKGTLGALKTAKSVLGEGLRSNSAMTASSKWGQSFGVGGAGQGGSLAYNKSGLVGLDKIKSGEIASLKMDKSKSLTTPAVGSPEKDIDGTNAALDKDKDYQKTKDDMADQIKKDAIAKALEEAGKSLTPNGKDKPEGKSGDGDKAKPGQQEQPPQAVLDVAAKNNTCAEGCTTPSGNKFDDNAKPQMDKNPDGSWNITYSGTQTSPDGTKIVYHDTVRVDPATGKVTEVGSMVGSDWGNMRPTAYGAN